ncbi:MAG: hypothetical protein CMH53_00900 [Myxococcales bacterium]|nr:hypothetical protein [Myxococcales bacterium]
MSCRPQPTLLIIAIVLSCIGCGGVPRGPSAAQRFATWTGQVERLQADLRRPVDLKMLFKQRYGPRPDSLKPSFRLLDAEQRFATLCAQRVTLVNTLYESRLDEVVEQLINIFEILAERRAKLLAEHLIRTRSKHQKSFCLARSRRRTVEVGQCPYPGYQALCEMDMLAEFPGLNHATTEGVRRAQLRSLVWRAFRKELPRVGQARDRCYARTLSRRPKKQDTYYGPDRIALLAQAKSAWRKLFRDEALLGVAISGYRWRRDIFSRVTQGRRKLFDLGTLRGFTYRDLGGGVARAERIHWRVDHLTKQRWVELCARQSRDTPICEPHDVQKAALRTLR